jgi:hypothetical protein
LTGRKHINGGLAQLSLNERLNCVESRLGGKSFKRAVTELDLHDRLDAIHAQVRTATDTLRRRARHYAQPTLIDRLRAAFRHN